MRHLILDLDQTLVHSLPNGDAMCLMSLDEQHYRPLLFHIHIDSVGYMFMKRPFLREFLISCFQRFESVSVWTAATKDYAERVVERVFEGLPPPAHVWHRDMCRQTTNGAYYKELSDFASATGLDVSSLCIVDDNKLTCQKNGEQAISVPAWEPCVLTHGESKDTVLQTITELFGFL